VSIAIDWLPVERLPELQIFIDEHWRRGHVLARDAELLRWQHRRREDPGRLAVLVAEEDGRLAGMLGFVEVDVSAVDQRAAGGWMTTWLVVPEARGRGLGLALVDRVLGSEYELVGALAANDATRHGLGGHGFVERGMLRWVRVFDVDALRKLLAGRPVPERRQAGGEAPSGRSGFAGACRDDAFLRHRYERHPRFDYALLRDGDELAAYRLEQVRGSNATVMRIVDFLGGEGLAAELAGIAEAAGVVFADFSCTSAPFGEPLGRVGFEREDRLSAALPGRFQPLDFSDRLVLSCFWVSPRLGIDLFGDDLYVTRADSDLDRPS